MKLFKTKIGIKIRVKTKPEINIKPKLKAKFKIRVDFIILSNLLLEFADLDYINFSKTKPNLKLLKEFFL